MSIDVADFSSADVAPQIVMVSGTHVGTGGNVTVFNATYIVPAGTHAIAIVMQRSAGAGTFTANPILTGHQSQYPYLNWALAGETSKRRIMPYFSAFDTSLDASLVLNAPVGTSVTYFLIAILDSMVVWAINNGIDAPLLGTQLFDSNGSVISLSQKTMLFSFPVVIASDQSAAPWQAPKRYPTVLSNAIGAGGTLNIIGGVAGQIIYVHDAYFTFSVAPGNWNLSDNVSQYFNDLGLTTGPYIIRHSGAPLTVANPLRIQITTACTVRGFVTASQQ